ncbi:hypothetical protein [Pimelobacter simplex]|uniref:hypothetical protein n=1 Tax=Nocardioides simplex TaxID=2045 RepID=UPI001932C10A|nr:hypothetical protein [Pimelobacter simplex]
MTSQLGRVRARAKEEEHRRQLLRRARLTEMLVIKALNALAQRGRDPRADVVAGEALRDLSGVEDVSLKEAVRLCRGEVDAAEFKRLRALACPQSALTSTESDHKGR